MTPEQYTELLQQHISLLDQIRFIWIAGVIASFIGLMFIGIMMWAAAWSVARVETRMETLMKHEATERKDLEAKFMLLIDALLARTARER